MRFAKSVVFAPDKPESRPPLPPGVTPQSAGYREPGYSNRVRKGFPGRSPLAPVGGYESHTRFGGWSSPADSGFCRASAPLPLLLGSARLTVPPDARPTPPSFLEYDRFARLRSGESPPVRDLSALHAARFRRW